MHDYPSDISREQFELIREELEQAKRRTRPRKYDLYDIFCGVLYVLRGGIQWRMLPSDFPKWQLVYYYFSVWSKADQEGISLLDRLLKKIGQNGTQCLPEKRENHIWNCGRKEYQKCGYSKRKRL